MDLLTILRAAVDAGASDLHLIPGMPPMFRRRTEIEPSAFPALSAEDVGRALEKIAPPDALARFEQQKDADFSFDADALAATGSAHACSPADAVGASRGGAAPRLGRFRVNAHVQRGQVALALRSTPAKAPALADLDLPEAVERLTRLARGLVLVTGHTGSGKSTTLAAMVGAINARDARHIITLEDPVEYAFESERCLVEQRELGRDMPSFSSGLRHALRQDPDIILVGEMRDLETAALAISAAETGHLVFATLHTINASRTVERIVDMFPPAQQQQVRSMLADTLQGVVSQTLFRRSSMGGAGGNAHVAGAIGSRGAPGASRRSGAEFSPVADAPSADGAAPLPRRMGMVAAVEVLLCTPATRNVIRESRTFEIANIIETSKAMGMQSLDSAIADLYLRGEITRDDALARCVWPERMERALAA